MTSAAPITSATSWHTSPAPRSEAYLRLRTLLGELEQVDWCHFRRLVVGRAMPPEMTMRPDSLALLWSQPTSKLDKT